ncbi:GTP cyclohydrolase 1 feedback regulatory protein isoform X1 [Trachemys scripta elegans]|uniref:GTP cyclohydrolase 1 feedback regulatory protein isoform X1 n=1 Tax=Trachemys scripta elegans TaxID=31138 RepID=UPI0015534785|nr:GTP cyclohydrolase 1 feedback regulatory protein isoform X1 [Trachemys scripta elegans]
MQPSSQTPLRGSLRYAAGTACCLCSQALSAATPGRIPVSTRGKEVGPTMVGDEHSDQHLMDYLGAIKRNMLGNHFWEYYVNDAPRIVLDKLEKYGYRVVSMTGVGQTLVWCLHKE